MKFRLGWKSTRYLTVVGITTYKSSISSDKGSLPLDPRQTPFDFTYYMKKMHLPKWLFTRHFSAIHQQEHGLTPLSLFCAGRRDWNVPRWNALWSKTTIKKGVFSGRLHTNATSALPLQFP